MAWSWRSLDFLFELGLKALTGLLSSNIQIRPTTTPRGRVNDTLLYRTERVAGHHSRQLFEDLETRVPALTWEGEEFRQINCLSALTELMIHDLPSAGADEMFLVNPSAEVKQRTY